MAMWIFLLICNLLIPVIMLGIGYTFRKHPPKTINWGYGYRTSRSMKNQDTWDFAHQNCGKIWLRAGCVMLPVTVLLMIFLIGQGDDVLGLWSVAIEIVQTVLLVGSIIPTELALKRRFDEQGRPREV